MWAYALEDRCNVFDIKYVEITLKMKAGAKPRTVDKHTSAVFRINAFLLRLELRGRRDVLRGALCQGVSGAQGRIAGGVVPGSCGDAGTYCGGRCAREFRGRRDVLRGALCQGVAGTQGRIAGGVVPGSFGGAGTY